MPELTNTEKLDIIYTHLKQTLIKENLPLSKPSLQKIAVVHLRRFDKPSSIYQTGDYYKG